MHLRATIEADAAALTDLVWHSKASNGYDEAFMEACRDELRVTPECLRAGLWWVVESSRLLGCCQLTIDADVGSVDTLFVAANAKGRGVGRQLWARVLSEAIDRRLARLDVEADPAAVGFYERMGLHITGSVPSGSIPGRQLPRMTLELPRARR